MSAWRAIFFVLFALSLAVYGYDIAGIGHGARGDFGFGVSWTSKTTPFTNTVVVPRTSSAYEAGLRTGDELNLRALPVVDRFALAARPAGMRLDLPVQRGTKRLIVRYVVPPYPEPWELLFEDVAGIVILIAGGIVAWRGTATLQGCLLCAVLILSWSDPLSNDVWASSLPAFAVIGALYDHLVRTPLLWVLPVLLFRSFDRRRSRAENVAFAAALAAPLLHLCYHFALYVGTLLFLSVDVTRALAWEPVMVDVSCALLIIYGALVLAGCRGAERPRFTLIYAAAFIVNFGFGVSEWGLSVDVPTTTIDAVAMTVAAIVFAYSLLTRRVLDIGFALNRAAVFTGVSVVIVGIFVLVEWALAQWFSSASHTTNLAISAVLALALGLSVRAIHSRVDRVLDAIFFRKRHEDEQAIRTLAREAAYITDPDVLLARMKAVLENHADAASVDIFLEDGGSYSPCHPERSERSERRRGSAGDLWVSENDPAIVRLRATRTVLDLHDVSSTIPGELAYPMLARGRLVGVLVLGPKRNGESYAPDESDAIAQLAHDAGAALDVLSQHAGHSDGAIAELSAIYQAIQALPAALSERIEEANRRLIADITARADRV